MVKLSVPVTGNIKSIGGKYRPMFNGSILTYWLFFLAVVRAGAFLKERYINLLNYWMKCHELTF